MSLNRHTRLIPRSYVDYVFTFLLVARRKNMLYNEPLRKEIMFAIVNTPLVRNALMAAGAIATATVVKRSYTKKKASRTPKTAA